MSALDLFATSGDEKVVCKRDRMIDAPQVDWIEWQACYASGAILMPKSAFMRLVEDFRREKNVSGQIAVGQEAGSRLIALAKTRFEVPEEAARVRLSKLGVLSSGPPQPTLGLF